MSTDNKLAEALRKQVADWNTAADIAATNGDNSGSGLLRICAQQAEKLLVAHAQAQQEPELTASMMTPAELARAQASAAEPVAFLHILHVTEDDTEQRLLSFEQENPWGVPGEDYDEWFPVTCEPLYTAPPAQEDSILPCDVRIAPATTIRAGCKLSTALAAIELRRGTEPPPSFENELTLAQQIADLHCTLWMVLKSAGGKVTIHRRIQREFDPNRSSLTRHDDGDGDVTFEAKESK